MKPSKPINSRKLSALGLHKAQLACGRHLAAIQAGKSVEKHKELLTQCIAVVLSESQHLRNKQTRFGKPKKSSRSKINRIALD